MTCYCFWCLNNKLVDFNLKFLENIFMSLVEMRTGVSKSANSVGDWIVEFYTDESTPVLQSKKYEVYMHAMEELSRGMKAAAGVKYAIIKRCYAHFSVPCLKAIRGTNGELEWIELETDHYGRAVQQKAVAYKILPLGMLYALSTGRGVAIYATSLQGGVSSLPTELGEYEGYSAYEALEVVAQDLTRGLRVIASK